MALLYGDFEVLEVNETQYVYKRRYLNDVVIVVFNKSPEKTTIIVNDTIRNYPFEAQFGSNLVKTDNSIAVTLAPYSFEILTVNLK